MEFKDYYKALGVGRDADQKAVSRAFRRLAREHHPDVDKRAGSEDRFKEINEAYQVLSDPAKRARYDQIYEAYKSGGGRWQDLFGQPGTTGWAGTGPGGVTFRVGDAQEFEHLFGQSGLGGFSDFFQQLFGGLGGFGRAGAGGPAGRGRSEAAIEVTLEEAFRGARRQVRLTETGRTLEVEIPKGVRSGQAVRLPGALEGDDLYLRVQIARHRLFERSGDDLTVELPLTVSEAALGADVEVPTLEGRVSMKIPEGTQSGARFRLRGLGMPHPKGEGRGDLYARAKVITPTRLSSRERELLEELAGARQENPRQSLLP